MKLHDLKPRHGSRKGRKRVGRGISAGQGKTAGRGTKGAGSRAGAGGKLHFQGGNLPFFRRLPFKRGFTPPFRVMWNRVNLDQLEGLEGGTEVTPGVLAEAGMLRDPRNPVVLLGRGEVKTALKVQVHRVSRSAQSKIEAAGGSVETLAYKPEAEVPWNKIELGDLKVFEAGALVNPETLAEEGLLDDPQAPVAISARGEVQVALDVRVHHISHKARRRILAAGGSVGPLGAS